MLNKFWNTDLKTIQDETLNGKKVTDLPIHLDKRVPPSDVLLESQVANTKKLKWYQKYPEYIAFVVDILYFCVV